MKPLQVAMRKPTSVRSSTPTRSSVSTEGRRSGVLSSSVPGTMLMLLLETRLPTAAVSAP